MTRGMPQQRQPQLASEVPVANMGARGPSAASAANAEKTGRHSLDFKNSGVSTQGDQTPLSTLPSGHSAAAALLSRESHTRRSVSGSQTDQHPRSLPSPDVSEETLDAAYTAFILYCNPSFPTSIDTTELVEAFRSPPRSDKHSFSTWKLFELIRKFEAKEIKTWNQLALDLGVEPPSLEKGGSTQKVQQYSVRLKRWMRMTHVDAFFEFLLGKHHPYYTEIPPLNDPFPERDGVAAEEDLAIRALDPSFKPKRGRRRAGSVETDLDTAGPRSKRLHLDTPIEFNPSSAAGPLSSAHPRSAFPTSAHPGSGQQDPWSRTSAASASKGLTPHSAMPGGAAQALRWRLQTQDGPSTPHPLSAVTPVDAPFDQEPMSAMTPSSTPRHRGRKRTGPAVSSAWSGANNTSSTKLRGRPPANRSIRDGSFSTFPATPVGQETPVDAFRRSVTPSAPSNPDGEGSSDTRLRQPQHVASGPSTTNIDPEIARAPNDRQAGPVAPQSAGALSAESPSQSYLGYKHNARGARLSVKVPEHRGGPVHQITPTVLVNGSHDSSGSPATPSRLYVPPSLQPISQPVQNESGSMSQEQEQRHQRTLLDTLDLTWATLARSLAKDLLGARLERAAQTTTSTTGTSASSHRLSGTEARSLAKAALERCGLHEPGVTPANGAHSGPDPASVVAVGSWLGLLPQLSRTNSASSIVCPTGGVKWIRSRRWRVHSDGFESPIDGDDHGATEPAAATRGGAAGAQVAKEKETFDVGWALHLAGTNNGEMEMRGLGLSGAGAGTSEELTRAEAIERRHAGERGGKEDVDWRKRFLEKDKELTSLREEVRSLKEGILNAVL